MNMNGGNRILIAAAIIAVTLLALAGIKFMMSDSSSGTPAEPLENREIFTPSDTAAPPPELNPLSRSASSSGGALDMFSKTNAGSGYYEEEEEPAASVAPVKPKAARSAAPAPKKTSSAKPKAKTTVIPRMTTTPFKSITPTNVSPSGAGGQQAMPDLSTIMKQAQEQAGQDRSGN